MNDEYDPSTIFGEEKDWTCLLFFRDGLLIDTKMWKFGEATNGLGWRLKMATIPPRFRVIHPPEKRTLDPEEKLTPSTPGCKHDIFHLEDREACIYEHHHEEQH